MRSKVSHYLASLMHVSIWMTAKVLYWLFILEFSGAGNHMHYYWSLLVGVITHSENCVPLFCFIIDTHFVCIIQISHIASSL